MSMPSLGQGLDIMSLAYDVISGKLTDPLQIGRRLMMLAVDMVPVDILRVYLDDEARQRADKAADTVENVKFGGSGG